MSGVKRVRLANGQAILQNGVRADRIIMPNPQKDLSGFGKRGESKAVTGGDVKAPKKSNVLTLKITNSESEGYMKNTPPPISNERPSRGEGPYQNVDPTKR